MQPLMDVGDVVFSSRVCSTREDWFRCIACSGDTAPDASLSFVSFYPHYFWSPCCRQGSESRIGESLKDDPLLDHRTLGFGHPLFFLVGHASGCSLQQSWEQQLYLLGYALSTLLFLHNFSFEPAFCRTTSPFFSRAPRSSYGRSNYSRDVAGLAPRSQQPPNPREQLSVLLANGACLKTSCAAASLGVSGSRYH